MNKSERKAVRKNLIDGERIEVENSAKKLNFDKNRENFLSIAMKSLDTASASDDFNNTLFHCFSSQYAIQSAILMELRRIREALEK